jgi:anti-sigma-K factor RskA
MTDALPEAIDIMAAELAFGLIDPADAEAARQRLERDPVFGAAHAHWFGYALTLFADAAETPPPHVWDAIVRRLPANDAHDRLNRRAARWRVATLAASVALVAVSAGTVWLATHAPAPAPAVQQAAPPAPMIALLQGKAGAVSVTFDPAARTLALGHGDLGLDARHSAQLWVIPADGKPRSLGLLPTAAAARHDAPAGTAALLTRDAVLAVSIEPLGGSPTGLPTGKVILTGKLAVAG